MDEIENEPHIAGLQFLGCSKRYGATQALSQVTFGVMPGSVVALVGANGAGKTTLLHALVGLVSLDTGDIQLDGVPSRSVAAKRRIAFMPDDLPRPVRLTARELVELTMRLYGCSDVDIDELGARMDLTGRLDQLLASYSHGMRRKADLMAALAVSPDVMVLDEPFSGLDPGMVAQLAAILEALRSEGKSVLVSSHDLELVQSIADHIVLIDCGRVAYQGPCDALLRQRSSSTLRDAFLDLITQ